jgi:hypothetical protein
MFFTLVPVGRLLVAGVVCVLCSLIGIRHHLGGTTSSTHEPPPLSNPPHYYYGVLGMWASKRPYTVPAELVRAV